MQILPSLIYALAVGSIGGLVWALALSARYSAGAAAGAIVGLILALLLAGVGRLARAGAAKLQAGETSFVSNGIITMFGLAAVVVGLLVWAVRALL